MRFFNSSSREGVTYVSLEDIRVNPYQPRKDFAEEKLKELAASIQEFGIIQPIVVRKMGAVYELVAGERRFRAAKIAGLDEVPALVKEYNDQDIARAALIENVQREDLNPLEEAQAYDQLLQNFNLTQESLARQVGKSQSTIANKRRLLKLPLEVQDLLRRGDMTERHGRALLKLPTLDLQIEMGNLILEKDLTVRETIKHIDILMGVQKGVEKAKRRRFVPRDLRIFINTISGAVKTMQQAGIPANVKESETEEYREFIIRIPKGEGH